MIHPSGAVAWCLEHYRARKRSQLRSRSSRRRESLLYYYRLTPEQYDEMLLAQGMACAVCGTLEPGWRGVFVVDHDHACCPGDRSCGQCVRGLLCAGCNRLLGLFGDDPRRARAAALGVIRYLERPRRATVTMKATG